MSADKQVQSVQSNPFSKGYKHRDGSAVSDACGDGNHADCKETWSTCGCTYRGGHTTMHNYLNSPIAKADEPHPYLPRFQPTTDRTCWRCGKERTDELHTQAERDFWKSYNNYFDATPTKG